MTAQPFTQHLRTGAPGVNSPLTLSGGTGRAVRGRSRRREPVENDAYTAFLARAIRAAGRRVATGDVEGLADLLALREDVDKAAGVALKGLREAGYSWDEIATRLGVTRQAVHQRWGYTMRQTGETR